MARRIEAVADVVLPALGAVGLLKKSFVVVLRDGIFVAVFGGCAVGFGEMGFYLARLYADESHADVSSFNASILLGFFSSRFGDPAPESDGEMFIWEASIDASRLRDFVAEAGGGADPSPPRMVH